MTQSTTPDATPVDGVKATDTDPASYLAESYYIDYGTPVVQQFVEEHSGKATTDKEKAVALFYAVRDKIRYNPHTISLDCAAYRASHVLEAGEGWCVSKGAAMTACLRAAGIPARPGYADVRNHLTSKRLSERMGTDVFSYHGYVDSWLDGRWVKATPVFNIELCDKVGVRPQEFDGEEDSLFQEFDKEGRRHMEYLLVRGAYTDVPFQEIMADFKARYPYLREQSNQLTHEDFANEAAALHAEQTAPSQNS
jgi:transglutaminase-like putative cysteine protease